jgi:hypothetical protein
MFYKKCWTKHGRNMAIHHVQECVTNIFANLCVEHPTNDHDMLMESYCAKKSKKNVVQKCWTKPGRDMPIHHVQACATNIFQSFGWNMLLMPMTH